MVARAKGSVTKSESLTYHEQEYLSISTREFAKCVSKETVRGAGLVYGEDRKCD